MVACLRCNDDFAVTTLHLTHCYLTIDFRNHGRVRRVTSFKQLGYTWETTRNITRTTYGTWNLNEGCTCLDFRTVLDDLLQVTTHREVVSSEHIFCCILSVGTLLGTWTYDIDCWNA